MMVFREPSTRKGTPFLCLDSKGKLRQRGKLWSRLANKTSINHVSREPYFQNAPQSGACFSLSNFALKESLS